MANFCEHGSELLVFITDEKSLTDRQPSKDNSYVIRFNGFKRIKENLHRIRYGEIFMRRCDRTFLSHLTVSPSIHRNIKFLLLFHTTGDFSITRCVSVSTCFIAVATVFNVNCE